jgi:hypothetical protein
MSTTTEQHKTVIRRFLEAKNNRQPEAFDELIANDVVRHCQATPTVEVRSLDQLKSRHAAWTDRPVACLGCQDAVRFRGGVPHGRRQDSGVVDHLGLYDDP